MGVSGCVLNKEVVTCFLAVYCTLSNKSLVTAGIKTQDLARLLNGMLTFVYLIAQDTTYASINIEQNGIIEAKFCLAAIECYLRKQCFFFLELLLKPYNENDKM